jgi:hypothetical protein
VRWRAPDAAGRWTGSIILHRSTFRTFYTGWNPDFRYPQTTCHTTSQNLIDWKKDWAIPALVPEERWYEGQDVRDPIFVFSPRGQWILDARLRPGQTSHRRLVCAEKSLDGGQRWIPFGGMPTLEEDRGCGQRMWRGHTAVSRGPVPLGHGSLSVRLVSCCSGSHPHRGRRASGSRNRVRGLPLRLSAEGDDGRRHSRRERRATWPSTSGPRGAMAGTGSASLLRATIRLRGGGDSGSQ